MTIKEFKGLDLKVYYEELENGLKVFLIPYDDRNNYYIEYGVKYGAEIDEFISSHTGKKTKAPYGVAHFLEHKMFEQEGGTDPFSYFSSTGTDSNASTGYRITSYTVDGIELIEKNLNYLIDFVNSPYFTDQNVEKEKGIIIEELNMYKDQPENILYEESNKALFKKHPMRRDVGGTPASVKKITKEILYECYDTFYQPNNMFLVIAGNLNPEKIIKLIKSNKKLNKKTTKNEIKVFKVKEPIEVNYKEKAINIKNMIIPKFIFNIKSPLKNNLTNEEKYKYMISTDILLYILFGMSSTFREEMLKKELYSLFYSSGVIVDDLMIIECVAESKKPNEFKNNIIKCLKEQEINKEDVERVKKVKISLEVMEIDKPFRVSDSIIDHLLDFGDVIYNKMDLIRSITLEDILEVRNNILIDNNSYVVGYPKK